MIRTKLSVKMPDVSARKLSSVLRDGFDDGLTIHRKKYLPRHFSRTATGRYGGPYNDKKPARSAAEKAVRVRQTSEARKQENKLQRAMNKDPQNRRPLFESGRMMRAAISGFSKLSGAARARKMVIRLPFYAHIQGPGQIHKMNALKVTAEDEQVAFAATVESHFDEAFNK